MQKYYCIVGWEKSILHWEHLKTLFLCMYSFSHEILEHIPLTRAIQSCCVFFISCNFIVGASLMLKRVNFHTERSQLQQLQQQQLQLAFLYFSTSPFRHCFKYYFYFFICDKKIIAVQSLMLFDRLLLYLFWFFI